jgi:tetratricopeptide (TPR) repeat protein
MYSKCRARFACLLLALLVFGLTVSPARSADNDDSESAESDAADSYAGPDIFLGDSDANPIHSLKTVGAEEFDRGRYDKATAAFKKMMTLQQRGADKPYDSLIWLGRIQLQRNNIPAATTLWRRSLEMREDMFGPEEEMVRVHRDEVASLYCAQKKTAQAAALYKRAVSVARNVDPLGADVMIGLNKLAKFYTQLKMYKQAAPPLREELVLRQAKKGIHDRETAYCRNQLALLYADMGLPQEALNLYDDLIARSTPNTDDQANAISQKAYFLVSTNKLSDATQCYRQAIAIRLPKLGTDQENRKCLMGNLKSLSRLLEKMGEVAEAETVHKQLLHVARQTFNYDAELDATRHYVTFLWRQHRMEEADKLMDRERELDPLFGSSYMRIRLAEFALAKGKRKLALFLLLDGAETIDDRDPWLQSKCLEKLRSLNFDVANYGNHERRLAVLVHRIEKSGYSSEDIIELEHGANELIKQGKSAEALKLFNSIGNCSVDLQLNHALLNIRLACGDVDGAKQTLEDGWKIVYQSKPEPEKRSKHSYRIQIPLEFMFSGFQGSSVTMDAEGGVYHKNVEFGGDYTVPSSDGHGSEERSESELLEFPVKRTAVSIVDLDILKPSDFHQTWDMEIDGKRTKLSFKDIEKLYVRNQERVMVAELKKFGYLRVSKGN